MEDALLELYWAELPEGKENAWSYERLCAEWGKSRRAARDILHQLSGYDNGDNMILIRSSSGAGFYKTADHEEIRAYRAECFSRGKQTFAPLRKIDRVLAPETGQMSAINNLRTARIMAGLQQPDVCQRMKEVDPHFDVSMLSRMENGRCFPTPLQTVKLAQIYGWEPSELVGVEFIGEM